MKFSVFRKASVALIVLAVFLAVLTVKEIKSLSYVGRDVQAVNTISVSGLGEVFAVPDVAEISFDVREEAKTTKEAQKEVTDKMNKIIDSLKKSGIAEKDIKTIGYNIYPKYEYQTKYVACPLGSYCPPEGRQILIGYEVSHNILVKVRDTEKSGEILSSLGSQNVSNLSGINFTIDDEEKVKNDAREKAIADAKEKADLLAEQLGVKLVRIMNFSESGNYPMYYAKAYGGAPTPMSASDESVPQIPQGENKVTSNVTITYEIR